MNKKIECDLQGRPWALVSEIKEGSIVTVDNGFSCMSPNVRKKVKRDLEKFQKRFDGLWISCKCGKHFLDGQYEDRDGTVEPFYMGVYKCL